MGIQFNNGNNNFNIRNKVAQNKLGNFGSVTGQNKAANAPSSGIKFSNKLDMDVVEFTTNKKAGDVDNETNASGPRKSKSKSSKWEDFKSKWKEKFKEECDKKTDWGAASGLNDNSWEAINDMAIATIRTLVE